MRQVSQRQAGLQMSSKALVLAGRYRREYRRSADLRGGHASLPMLIRRHGIQIALESLRQCCYQERRLRQSHPVGPDFSNF
jgi:hypothetical protein